jgi:hypothetical protein
VHGQRQQRVALCGGGPVQLGGSDADRLLLRLDLREGGLLGVAGLLQLGLPLGDLVLQLPVAAGVLEQRTLRGEGERGGVERTAARAVSVGTRQHQGRHRGKQQRAHGDDAETGRPADAGPVGRRGRLPAGGSLTGGRALRGGAALRRGTAGRRTGARPGGRRRRSDGGGGRGTERGGLRRSEGLTGGERRPQGQGLPERLSLAGAEDGPGGRAGTGGGA